MLREGVGGISLDREVVGADVQWPLGIGHESGRSLRLVRLGE